MEKKLLGNRNTNNKIDRIDVNIIFLFLIKDKINKDIIMLNHEFLERLNIIPIPIDIKDNINNNLFFFM